MWRKIAMTLILAFGTLCAAAQVHLSPVAVVEVDGTGAGAKTQLENKLRAVLSARKMMTKYGDSRFVLAAHLSVVEKEVVPSAPPKVAMRLALSVAVGDGVSGTCFATTELQLKGVGQNDNAAVIAAIRAISASDKRFNTALQDATQRIISYYDEQWPNIAGKVETLDRQAKYEEAIYELSLIPMECSSYAAAQQMMSETYKHYVTRIATETLTEARAMWASDPTGANAPEVMAMLQGIDPTAENYGEVEAFIKEVEKKVTRENEQRREDEIAARKDALELEKAQLKAIESVAKAYAESQPDVVYNVYGWW